MSNKFQRNHCKNKENMSKNFSAYENAPSKTKHKAGENDCKNN